MLPDNLREHAAAAAVEAFDSAAVTGGKYDRGELTLEIAPARIASVCGFLKHDRKFVRLSTVTCVDRYPSEPRFEVVYHLHSVEDNQRLRLKCRLPGAEPAIDSVTPVWRAADWYEREAYDLFGRHVPQPSGSAPDHRCRTIGRATHCARIIRSREPGFRP